MLAQISILTLIDARLRNRAAEDDAAGRHADAYHTRVSAEMLATVIREMEEAMTLPDRKPLTRRRGFLKVLQGGLG